MSARGELAQALGQSRARLVEIASGLLAHGSPTPPGDCRAVAAHAAALLGGIDGVVVQTIAPRDISVNVVARVSGARPGRRLVWNGHFDHYPVGDATRWTVPPLAGTVRDGRLHGRGVCDMKAGMAAGILTAMLLAERRAAFAGEFVLCLVADEGGGGAWGTTWLLDHLPEASGDAVLSGDTGDPGVLTVGEKGYVFLELSAEGRGAHGANPRGGVNALDRLIDAVGALRSLERMPTIIPPEVTQSAQGTAAQVTLNLGALHGGVMANLVPDAATALLDLRIPPGLTVAALLEAAERQLAGRAGVTMRVLPHSDPSWTDEAAEIVRRAAGHATARIGRAPTPAFRLGYSDARLYRARGMPTLVYGPAPHNHGGIDEHVLLDDLDTVAFVHAMTAFDYLAGHQ